MSKKKYKGLMIQNKNSKRNYELIEYYEAGISLSGTEVKSIVAGRTNISDSYCVIKKIGRAHV